MKPRDEFEMEGAPSFLALLMENNEPPKEAQSLDELFSEVSEYEQCFQASSGAQVLQDNTDLCTVDLSDLLDL
ncbi:unnamed protein product [Leuciscus chuanchicus]